LGSRARAARRLVAVLYYLVPLLLTYARDRRRYLLFGRGRTVTSEDRRRRAERLLGSFVALGPTFIKLGQVLSTRADALPREYTETLSKLQDDVPPADWDEARRVLEDEVGTVERFDSFDQEAVSAASLGQVHVAVLGGRRLAVKILRPGVRETVETDLNLLRSLLPVVTRFVDENTARSVENVVDQFASSVRRETDYGHEAETMETFRENFADDPDVVIPEVFEDLSGDRVITMEYVESVKIDDAEAIDSMGIDRSEVVAKLQRTYAEMVLEDGLFHADPHPGNLGVDAAGRLVFYDFGLVGSLSEETRDSLFEFYEAVRDEDIGAMTAVFERIGVLPPDYDPDEVEAMFRGMVDDLNDQTVDSSARNIVTDIQDSMYGFPVHVTRELALLFRAITVLEGVCQSLDEEFNFTHEAYLFVLRDEYGAVAEAVEMVPEPVKERVGVENIRWMKERIGPFAEFLRGLRTEG